jgi:hypothetical protein
MGRVTVIRTNGTLSTARCDTCNGEGYIMEHYTVGCEYCEHAAARAMRATPMFEA